MKYYSPNRKSVVAEHFDGEVVLVQLETGAYYSLSNSAGAIWALLECELSTSEIASQLSTAAGRNIDGIAMDVEAFIVSLEAEGLVVSSSEPASAVPPPAIQLTSYTSPSFEKFGDMADLILLDPIHDVDAEGWPLRPTKEEILAN